jgi:hypothetical protein
MYTNLGSIARLPAMGRNGRPYLCNALTARIFVATELIVWFAGTRANFTSCRDADSTARQSRAVMGGDHE